MSTGREGLRETLGSDGEENRSTCWHLLRPRGRDEEDVKVGRGFSIHYHHGEGHGERSKLMIVGV